MARSLFYVGTCNRVLPYLGSANGKGIAGFWLDDETGGCYPAGVTEGIDNPTFLAIHPVGRALYANSEVMGWNEGTLTAYAVDPATGALDYLGKQPTLGDIPAQCDFDQTGRFIGNVNYCLLPTTAKPNRSVVVYPLSSDGSLGAPVADSRHEGIGTDPVWQTRSHAHCVRWSRDNRFMIVADLGLDRLVVYRFDAATGAITPHGGIDLPPRSGPRHFIFHPTKPVAYVVNEGASSVASLAYDEGAGSFAVMAVEFTVPETARTHNLCSAIRVEPSGRHLYVGNRGHDSISHFAIDPVTGIAHFAATFPCGGRTPRDFDFDPSGRLLVVANQDSDSVQVFAYKPTDGSLEPFGPGLATGTPTAIAFYARLE